MALPPGPSRRALTALVLAVLGLHLLLLFTLESPLTLQLSAGPAAPMRVRVLAPPEPSPAAPAARPALRAPAPASERASPGALVMAPSEKTAVVAAPAAAEPAASSTEVPGAVPSDVLGEVRGGAQDAGASAQKPAASAASGTLAAAQPATSEASSAAPSTAWPLVPLGALPPSMALSYRLFGMDKGLNYFASGELRWQHNDRAYDLTLSVRAFLIGSRRWRSQGQIEATGLAPQRYADSWRNERAAHFDRSGQRVVFSSNSTPAVLEPGAQDQISLYVQLAAAMAGEPERFVPGTRLQVQTVTTRDALPWSLVLQGQEELELEGERRPVYKWVCQPHNRYEARVEIWVSAAQAWMPVRIRITQNSGSFIDLLWRGTEPLPPLPTAAVGSDPNTAPQGS